MAIGIFVAPFTGMFLGYLLQPSGLTVSMLLDTVAGAFVMGVFSLLFGGPLIAFPGALAYALLLLALPQQRVLGWYREHPWLTSIVLGAGAGAAIGAVSSHVADIAMQFGPAAPLGGAVSSTIALNVYVGMLDASAA